MANDLASARGSSSTEAIAASRDGGVVEESLNAVIDLVTNADGGDGFKIPSEEDEGFSLGGLPVAIERSEMGVSPREGEYC